MRTLHNKFKHIAEIKKKLLNYIGSDASIASMDRNCLVSRLVFLDQQNLNMMSFVDFSIR